MDEELYQQLREVAQSVLDDAVDRGKVNPTLADIESMPTEAYRIGPDGELWFNDWFDLQSVLLAISESEDD